MDKPNPTFQQALETFTRSIVELNDTWEREDHTGDYFIDGYPFDKSLADIVRDVINWRNVQARLEEVESGLGGA